MNRAGYSATPLARKLGIRPGSRVALIGAPKDLPELHQAPPDGVTVHRRLTSAPYDVIVCFSARQEDLERRLARLQTVLAEDGGLWLAWPKQSSGVPTDLTERTVRDLGLAAGLVDNKVCAIDATWSGLRFVYRVADRRRAKT